MGRQVKKTVIKYEASEQKAIRPNLQQQKQIRNNQLGQVRQRSRQKSQVVSEQNNKKEVTVDVNSRKARLQAMKKAREQKEKQQNKELKIEQQNQGNSQLGNIKIVIVHNQQLAPNLQNNQPISAKPNGQDIIREDTIQKPSFNQTNQTKVKILEPYKQPNSHIKTSDDHPQKQPQESQSQSASQNSNPRILHKPVFLSKEDRSHLHEQQPHQKLQEQRRKKSLKYTTKLLLEETLRKDEESNSEDQLDNLNDDQDQTNLPDDSDDKNQQLQYELWKIRQLKRIRRDREARQKHLMEKLQIERRRQMNNEQILLENRLLGSDSTSQQTETKYVFMQKYYHKGAFYQDSSDPIFQRDYNLPTPMETQDKSGLPQVLQKRKGNFGKRGQSKYTHLTAEDTTDTNPLTRADESLLNSWKKKMAGYKK